MHAEKGLFVLKAKKDKLDIDKLKNVSRDLNKLRTKVDVQDVDKSW